MWCCKHVPTLFLTIVVCYSLFVPTLSPSLSIIRSLLPYSHPFSLMPLCPGSNSYDATKKTDWHSKTLANVVITLKIRNRETCGHIIKIHLEFFEAIFIFKLR